jgi:hypothetical protein
MAGLIVYVAPGCLGCARAYQLVEILRSTFQRDDVVQIIDTTEPDVELPADFVAVPSWYVNGARLSLGNPPEHELRAVIESRIIAE